MSTRIVIEAEGDLPEAGKFAILAAAEVKFALWLEAFNKEHKTNIVGTVRPVTAPRKKAEKPAGDKSIAPQGIDPATGQPTAGVTSALSAAVAAELAEKDHPAGRRHGLHLSEPAAAE